MRKSKIAVFLKEGGTTHKWFITLLNSLNWQIYHFLKEYFTQKRCMLFTGADKEWLFVYYTRGGEITRIIKIIYEQ